MTTQRIVVEAKSKFGVLDKTTEKWVNFKDKETLPLLKVGGAYDVGMDHAKGTDGKTRLMAVSFMELKEASSAPAKVEDRTAVAVNVPVKEGKHQGAGLSVYEKDSRILAQGLIQALLQSPLINMIPDNVTPSQYLEATTAELMMIVKKLSGTL